jgi:hypothetical protein
MPRSRTTTTRQQRRQRERRAAIAVIGLAIAAGGIAAWLGSPQPWENPGTPPTTSAQTPGSS